MICLRVKSNKAIFPLFLMTQVGKFQVYANVVFITNYFRQVPSREDAVNFSLRNFELLESLT